MAKKDPLDGKLVVLLGGSGFFGHHIAQDLLERGARLRIASRDPAPAFKLKPLANLGQMQLVRCDVTQPGSLEQALAGADAAVFLAGAFEGDLEALMERAPGNAARIAKEQGAKSFAFISAIGVDPESDVPYSRTKARGERNVLAAFPEATIIRPSIIFGSDDNFLNMFGQLIRLFPVLPVFGPDAELQLVNVDDAAAGVVAALADPGKHGGKTYDIAGPQVLTMGQINRKIAQAQGRERAFIDLPDFVSRTFAKATGWLPFAPLSLDQWKLLERGSVADGSNPGIEKLGITPRPLDLFLERWMTPMRRHGRFTDRTEFAQDYRTPEEQARD
ncbi:MAG: complex I NDUFA9 subunit family protein [Alteripontixanthobacter sp.]